VIRLRPFDGLGQAVIALPRRSGQLGDDKFFGFGRGRLPDPRVFLRQLGDALLRGAPQLRELGFHRQTRMRRLVHLGARQTARRLHFSGCVLTNRLYFRLGVPPGCIGVALRGAPCLDLRVQVLARHRKLLVASLIVILVAIEQIQGLVVIPAIYLLWRSWELRRAAAG